MASKITQEYRKSVADMFIKCLEEETLDWKKNWAGLGTPVNFSSHAQYKGVNKFYLTVVMMKHGWEDNRFMTFNQIKAKGLKLKAGSHGAKVEYWMPFDVKQKKALNWKEYKELIKGMSDDEIENRFGLTAKYYTVFNGSMIEGLPEFKLERNTEIEPDKVIEQVSKGMGVEILHDGGDRAFYRGSEDKIHLPVPGAFNTSYDYNCTALHELGHATGATHRLNRDMGGGFGSKEYAREELVAEITSAFMGVYLGDNSKATEQDFNNHKAYVQDWISAIKEKPETLFNAIKQAEAAADYMEKAGDLVKEKVVSLEDVRGKKEEQEYIYQIEVNPRSESEKDRFFLQVYEKDGEGKAIPRDILFIGSSEDCQELLRKLKNKELTQEQVKEMFTQVKEQEESEEMEMWC